MKKGDKNVFLYYPNHHHHYHQLSLGQCTTNVFPNALHITMFHVITDLHPTLESAIIYSYHLASVTKTNETFRWKPNFYNAFKNEYVSGRELIIYRTLTIKVKRVNASDSPF